MKKAQGMLIIGGFLFAGLLAAPAQTNTIIVTNFVTVLITNVVTVTNVIPPPPPPPPVVSNPPTTPPALPAPVKYPWQSSISAGMTLVRGNKDSTMITGDFTTKKTTAKNDYTLGTSVAYGEQDSVSTIDNYKVYGQWNHHFSERLYDYGRVDGLHDSIASLEYRVSAGPGVGYYFIKGKTTSLSTEVGASLEAQKQGDNDEYFATVRLAEQFEKKFNDRARLWETAEIFPQVDVVENYVVNFEIGIETSLTKSFYLKTYLQDTYTHTPAPDRKKNDAKIVAAVSYKF